MPNPRQSQSAAWNSGLAVVLSKPVLANSLIVAVAIWDGALISFSAMSDTVNTYSQRGSTVSDPPLMMAWTDALNVTAGSYTVTCNFSGGNPTDAILFVNEYAATSTTFDATAAFRSGTGVTGDPVTSAITPTGNNELVVCAAGVLAAGISLAVGSGFGNLLDGQGSSLMSGAIEDLTQTTAAQIASPGFSTSVGSKWAAACAAYALVPAATATGGQLTTCGVG